MGNTTLILSAAGSMSNQRRNPSSWITILFLCFQCGWGAESSVMQCPLLQGQPSRPLMLCLGKRVVDLTTVSTGSAWSRTLSAISATERNSDNTTRNTTQRKGNGNCDEYIHWFQEMCVETPFCCQWYRDSDSAPTPKENLHGNDNEQKRGSRGGRQWPYAARPSVSLVIAWNGELPREVEDD